MRSFTMLASVAVIGAVTLSAGATAHADDFSEKKPLLKGSTTASYYWDDASGRNGDTGLPASGKPMQKGLAASPSWPLLTEGYVVYKGKKEPFFVGDRGPGVPSNRGIMLDLDAKTFASLTGGKFNSSSLSVDGVGGQGHIKIEYVITKWGPGVGKKNHPVAFSTGAWSRKDARPATPPVVTAEEKKTDKKDEERPETPPAPAQVAEKAPEQAPEKAPVKASAQDKAPQAELAAAVTTRDTESNGVGGLALISALAFLSGGMFLARGRIRKAFDRS
ncbi:hypothetical protein HNR40_002098 [Nonomuraea endophytica]|uniref:LPXTG cell wall anchor domain-containing protein n=2 Tax=Nonomuraea endophytica TaxID=714136 RepID=A0A7W7ZZI9_9ACTN|nr:hypothetical protein [Nonomuraea endophytica]